MSFVADAVRAYRLRWKRRRYLYRAFRKRGEVEAVVERTRTIRPDDILVFSTVRNEALRLPHFLAHHRRLGAGHFLFVDNGSDDGTAELLADQPDASLWRARGSYKASRFGLDWLTGLLARHGTGHWCLTLDADELLVYPHCETRPLAALAEWLDATGMPAFGALMLDLYPEGPLGSQAYAPGDDPLAVLTQFDPGPYTVRRQEPLGNLWVQGGARARAFFADAPRRAPTLNKLPLVKWRRGYVYVNSTHSMLPRRLNHAYDGPGGAMASGALLHTKFLPDAVARAAEERRRRQHFHDPDAFAGYYDAIVSRPVLQGPQSLRYEDWRQLERLGLLSRGAWA